MRRLTLSVLLSCALSIHGSGRQDPRVIEHVTVYQEAGRFGGWPANHGIWSWGNEILVGFSAAYFLWSDRDGHPYDRSKPEEPRLARSLDGGKTWTIETPRSLLPPDQGGKPAAQLKRPMDFTHPGFALTLRFTDVNQGPSLLFYSYDRGKNWEGAFEFPLLGQPGIAARTDYLVNSKRDALVFLTASKSNGREGRPLCARTTDGGLNWEMLSWVAPEPTNGFTIMPSSVRLSPSEILTAVRHEENYRKGPNWIDAYLSRDNGRSWQFLNRAAADTGARSGNPPSMIRLKDGRVALTYGYRSMPYSIRGRLSADGGRTWDEEIMLRDHGAAWDVGYPRTVQRPDGKIITVYYWAHARDKERIIAATIWDPGPARK
jgi:hypothetical protein